jgi:hypothetical protein
MDFSVVLTSAVVAAVVSGLFMIVTRGLERRASVGDLPSPLTEGEVARRGFLTSLAFWQFILPMGGAVFLWYWNERQKRITDQYHRKEAKYKELLQSLQGFYDIKTGPDLLKLRGEFLDQLRQCWLYCPDDVIQKGYAFLDTVHTDQMHSDKAALETKQKAALDNFVAAIRQDLLSESIVRSTTLTGADFRHLRVNQ